MVRRKNGALLEAVAWSFFAGAFFFWAAAVAAAAWLYAWLSGDPAAGETAAAAAGAFSLGLVSASVCAACAVRESRPPYRVSRRALEALRVEAVAARAFDAEGGSPLDRALRSSGRRAGAVTWRAAR